MVHMAETDFKLEIETVSGVELPKDKFSLLEASDVVLLEFPLDKLERTSTPKQFLQSDAYRYCQLSTQIGTKLKPTSTLLILGSIELLPYIHAFIEGKFTFHDWIAVRLAHPHTNGSLANEHAGLTVYTKESKTLKHAKIRIAYTYCPSCEKTTKDYGGRKHLYHEYGTLMSDVWKDINLAGDPPETEEVVERVRDMFSVEGKHRMLVVKAPSPTEITKMDLPDLDTARAFPPQIHVDSVQRKNGYTIDTETSHLFNSDAIKTLERVPDETIDLAFADPPYNLSKKYRTYKDNKEINQYYKWCDLWLEHLVRVLKPGGSLVVVNIPLRAIRHYLYLQQRVIFQNWIVWESLSMPVRFIMPSHYTLLFYTKGEKPKTFNYTPIPNRNPRRLSDLEDEYIYPLADDYCLRSACIRARKASGVTPKKELTDLWTDISRIKHNTRRTDHPCQLPSKLMKRIILLLSNRADVILDCFNGVGTTTLSAHQLDRKYIGVEISEIYNNLALKRHDMIMSGNDPFAKTKGIPREKNTNVPRMGKTKYKVPKKELQLEVKRIAKEVGHIPTKDEVAKRTKYPMRFYDNYFKSWSEATAAARTTGMKETKPKRESTDKRQTTLSHF